VVVVVDVGALVVDVGVVVLGAGGATVDAGGTPDSVVPVVWAASWLAAMTPADSTVDSAMATMDFIGPPSNGER
jgi:hypothetical protein